MSATANSRTVSRRSFLRGAVSVAAAGSMLSLAGCGTSPAEPTAAGPAATQGTSGEPGRSEMTILFNDAPSTLDPHEGWDGWYTSARGLTETLVRFDRDMAPSPSLATSWERVDDLTWRFTVRKGVTFHSGAAMDPAAVKASLERVVEKSARAAGKIRLSGVEVGGDDVVITTSEPVETLPGELAEPVFSIVEVAAADEDPSRCGTGPYMGEDVADMGNLVLVAHEGYWGGTPAVGRLTCRMSLEPSTRMLALRSGDAQVAASLLAADVATLKADAGYQVIECESVRTVFSFMNMGNPHLARPEVRRALSLAVDREVLANTLLGGAIKANGMPFPSYLPCSEAVADAAQGYDAEQAATLLEEAGYKAGADGVLALDGDPLALRLAYYSSRPELPLIAQALQDMFGSLGVSLELVQHENVDELFKTDAFDLLLYNATSVGNGDPSYFLSLYFSSEGSENAGCYANDEVDALCDELRGEPDPDRRTQIAADAVRLILEDCACLFFGTAVMNACTVAGVKGFEVCPVEYYGVTGGLA